MSESGAIHCLFIGDKKIGKSTLIDALSKTKQCVSSEKSATGSLVNVRVNDSNYTLACLQNTKDDVSQVLWTDETDVHLLCFAVGLRSSTECSSHCQLPCVD